MSDTKHTMHKWTREDEAQLLALQKLKEEFERQHRTRLEQVVGRFHFQKMDTEKLVEALIQHAEEIRDALNPYDSGVRIF